MKLFGQLLQAVGTELPKWEAVRSAVLPGAGSARRTAGGVLSYNYYSGELSDRWRRGRPPLVWNPESRLNLPNFMRA